MEGPDDTQPPPLPPQVLPAESPAMVPIEYLDRRLAPKRGLLGATLRSPWFWPVAVVCYAVIGWILVGVFAGAIGAAVGLRSVVVGMSLLGLLLLAATTRLMGGIRRNRARTALGYLDQAARLNLPLPVMLRAAESAEAGGARRAIRRLRTRLEDGLPIARALGEALSGTSAREVRLIEAGENAGRLGSALRRLVRQDRSKPRRDPTTVIFLRWYPLVLTIGVGGVCSLLLLFVLPRYQYVFPRPRPPLIQRLGEWSDTVGDVFLFIGPLLLLGYLARMTAAIFSPRLQRPASLGWLIDSMLWRLPLARGVVRGRGLADVCNVLADALEAGHTPLQAMTNAGELKLNAVLRGRVRRWAERVEAGVPLADAARAAQMPKLLVGMLSSAAGDDVPRVLQFLARYYESRFSRAAELLRGAAIPALALGFGAVVLGIAYAVLVPLIDMADTMCSKLSRGGL